MEGNMMFYRHIKVYISYIYTIGTNNKHNKLLPVELFRGILLLLDFESKLEARVVNKQFKMLLDDFIRMKLTFYRHDWEDYIEADKELYFQRKLYVSRVNCLTFDGVDFKDLLEREDGRKQALIELFNRMIRLDGISLVGCCGLNEVFTCLPTNLQRLSVYFDYSGDKHQLTDNTLKQYHQRNGSLLKFELVQLSDITNDGMEYISTRLTSFRVNYVVNIHNEGIRLLPSSLVKLSLETCRHVNSLLHCSFLSSLESLQVHFTRLGDEDMKALGTRLTSLVVFCDYNSLMVTDNGLDSIVGRLRRLKLCYTDEQDQITYRTVSKATQLRSLELNSGFGVEQLELSQYLTRLSIQNHLAERKWIKTLPESLQELDIQR